MRNGLYDDSINQILEDGAGNLWMSSNKGLFSVEKSQVLDLPQMLEGLFGVAPRGLGERAEYVSCKRSRRAVRVQAAWWIEIHRRVKCSNRSIVIPRCVVRAP